MAAACPHQSVRPASVSQMSGDVQLQLMVQGATLMVNAFATTTVWQLEHMVASRTSVPSDAFALYFAGKPLRGNKPLAAFLIMNGSLVELKMRGRGGGCAASISTGDQAVITECTQACHVCVRVCEFGRRVCELFWYGRRVCEFW